MQQNAFEEKLYTSTEVAEILGVSLRSIYRYLDDNKIQAAVKTATGRHRFTRQNINDFLHPSQEKAIASNQNLEALAPDDSEDKNVKDSKVNKMTEWVSDDVREETRGRVTKTTEETEEDEDMVAEDKTSVPEEKPVVQDEPVDWLARFRQAAEKYKTQSTAESPENAPKAEPQLEKVHKKMERYEEPISYYYRSGVGGLKEIAQSLDKSAKNASLDYAFTMSAGLSLHKPIKPFSLIHSYVRPQDLAYFEKVLQLSSCQKDTAQLCLIATEDEKLYAQRKELHGLYVVSDAQIKSDLLAEGETELANELD